MNPKTQTIIALLLLPLNAAMALYLYPISSTRSIAMLITIGAFACVWAGARTIARAKGCDWVTSKTRREIVGSIITASLVLLGANIAIALRDAGYIEGDISKRIVGVVLGAVLVFMGNAMPKKLAPTCRENSNTANLARTQRVQRFMGWTFVLAGLIYMGIWLTVDLDRVGYAVLLSFPAAIAVMVIARLIALRSARSKQQLDHPV